MLELQRLWERTIRWLMPNNKTTTKTRIGGTNDRAIIAGKKAQDGSNVMHNLFLFSVIYFIALSILYHKTTPRIFRVSGHPTDPIRVLPQKNFGGFG